MTALTDRPEVAEEMKRVEGRNRFLTITTVVLATLVVVLGVLFWNDNRGGSTLPAEVQHVVDDYIDAIVSQDPDGWGETITDDWFYYRHHFGPNGFDDVISLEPSASEYAGWIEFKPPNGFEYEQLGDPLVTGNGPWFITIRQRWTELPAPGWNPKTSHGTTTYVVIEQDEAMKVAAAYWTGTTRFSED